MTEKKSFLIYFDWEESLKMLSNEEMGELFWALFSYAKNGDMPKLESRSLSLVFYILKGHIDRDLLKYTSMCERNRNIAIKRWNKDVACIESNTDDYQKYHSYNLDTKNTDKDKDKEKDKDKGKVNENDTTPSPLSPKADGGYSDDFLLFWAEYPKKVGKAEAFKRYKRMKLGKADNADIITALKWQRNCTQWQRDGGRFVPNPATYLSQRRWEDEPVYDGFGQYSDPNRYTDGDELPGFILNGGD